MFVMTEEGKTTKREKSLALLLGCLRHLSSKTRFIAPSSVNGKTSEGGKPPDWPGRELLDIIHVGAAAGTGVYRTLLVILGCCVPAQTPNKKKNEIRSEKNTFVPGPPSSSRRRSAMNLRYKQIWKLFS